MSLSFFKVILPAHPKYLAIHTLRESAYLWSIGERNTAKENLLGVFKNNSGNGAIAGQLIEYCFDSGEEEQAEKTFLTYHKTPLKTELEQPYLRYFRCLINGGSEGHAKRVIGLLDERYYFADPLDVAISFKRIKEFERAHIIFSKVYHQFEDHFDYLRNYAEVKISLSNKLRQSRGSNWSAIKRLQREAHELLLRAIPLAPAKSAEGWCQFNLARVKSWLRYSSSPIEQAYKRAIELLPEENIFSESYERWKSRSSRSKRNGGSSYRKRNR